MTAVNNLQTRVIAITMLVVSFALLLVIHFVSPPTNSLWMQTFANSLHVPIFGVIALSLFVATGIFGNMGIAMRTVVAIAAACLLGVLSEAAQIPGPRHASIDDLLSDCLGAAGTVLIGVAITERRTVRRWIRGVSAMVGLSFLLIALGPLMRISAAYVERDMLLPHIVSFDSRFGNLLVLTQHARLTVLEPAISARNGVEVTLMDGAWPGVIFHDIWPDWTDYSTLVIELGMPGDEPLDVHIRVHDRIHRRSDQPYNDRFNLEYHLQPGEHTLRVPLERIRNAPADREMVMSEIDGIVIFCASGHAGRVFHLGSVRLE